MDVRRLNGVQSETCSIVGIVGMLLGFCCIALWLLTELRKVRGMRLAGHTRKRTAAALLSGTLVGNGRPLCVGNAKSWT